MKRIIIIVSLLLGTTILFAQHVDTTLTKEMTTIKNNVLKQRKEINVLKEQFEKQEKYIGNLLVNSKQQEQILDSLKNVISTNSKNIITNSNELGTEIQKVTTITKEQISYLDSTIDKNRLYWIIVSVIILLLGAIMYLFIGKRIKSSKTDVEVQIRNTKQTLEEEGVKLDNKLVEILETQLKVKAVQPKQANKETDHSLALRVADEIIRIRKNMSRMDENTKGLKQLSKSIERIQNEFASNSYEIVEMLGKPYVEGMNVTANPIPDNTLKPGQKIISRIIKPQVNFKGVMIQQAQIDVSQGD